MLKKILSVILILCLLANLSACAKPEETPTVAENPNEEFAAFVTRVLVYELPSDNFYYNLYFIEPQNYGIETEPYVLDYISKEEWDASVAEAKELLAELDGFETNTLDATQQVEAIRIRHDLEYIIAMEDYYYLDVSYLGASMGMAIMLPTDLENYEFFSKQDIDWYLSILEQAPAMFQTYADHEEERIKNGVGFNSDNLNRSIEQAEKTAAITDYFLVKDFQEKIDALDYLSAEEKQAYKDQQEEIIYNTFLPGYQALADRLKMIDASAMDGLTLADKPQGIAYYDLLIKHKAGIDMTTEELKAFYEAQMSNAILQIQQVAMSDPDILVKANEGTLFIEPMLEVTSVEEAEEFFKTAITEDFPAIEEVAYQISKVDESNSDMGAAAYYMPGRYDAPKSSPEQIFINGDFAGESINVYAHEGYPGHLYQFVYVKQNGISPYLYLSQDNAYVEGWGTYVMNYVVKYSNYTENEKIVYFYNMAYSQALVGLMDIMVNVEGYSRDELYDFLVANVNPELTREYSDETYNELEEVPVQMHYYAAGFLMVLDMREEIREGLGDKYSDLLFHTFFLDHCGYSLSDLKELVPAFIEANK
ncbi:MAG: DUF885 domain-containing protein [Erysipelotrichaceae bacterium]|jgi:uncharacterized protein (DUF885 family)|nr:DUF885 domain-containing protein [Erysipelotrichaceae bacterium]